jgi:RHS repeat-associated protein
VTEDGYAYSAYGDPVFANASGTVLSESAKDNRYTYTGREWDEELSLYHFRARMYDAECGRFLGRDLITVAGSFTLLYGFILGSTLQSTDPTGLYEVSDGDVKNAVSCIFANLGTNVGLQTGADDQDSCARYALRIALSGGVSADLGGVGIQIILSGISPLLSGLRGVLTRAVLREALEAAINNQNLSDEELQKIVLDILTNVIGRRLTPEMQTALDTLAKEIVEQSRNAGKGFGYRFVSYRGTASSCSADCMMTVCVNKDGAFSVPSTVCSYRCKKRGIQSCICGGGDQILKIGKITGVFESSFFSTSCKDVNIGPGR